jgi:hypothetical protein
MARVELVTRSTDSGDVLPGANWNSTANALREVTFPESGTAEFGRMAGYAIVGAVGEDASPAGVFSAGMHLAEQVQPPYTPSETSTFQRGLTVAIKCAVSAGMIEG